MEAFQLNPEFMVQALRLAGGVLPLTAPNPAVGCVLVRDGEIVGQGATLPPGGNHAEIEALAMAGATARGATAYVTLEPCAHHGRTPPCTRALIKAGVAQVVVACLDPDPRVNGQGVAQLRSAGIEVACGQYEAEAKAINRGFFSRSLHGRPWVTFKTALSIDGRIATATGDSRWISGETSRTEVHQMRHTVDAVLVGAGTARADNPRLTARGAGQKTRAPWRVVVTATCDLDPDLNLFSDEFADKTIVLTGVDRSDAPADLSGSPVHWITCAMTADGRVNLKDGLERLGAFGINHVQCEAGPALAAGLWADALIDEVICFRAPIVLGGDGRPAWNALGVERLNHVSALPRVPVGLSGEDIREHYLTPMGAQLIAPAALAHLTEILRDPAP